MSHQAKGSRKNKFTFWRERRAGRCKALRRRRCRCASSRSSDKADGATPPPPAGRTGIAGDLRVARRQRCPHIASSSLLDLAARAPSAYIAVIMNWGT